MSIDANAMEQLLHIMARLRDPDSGCPWDRQQTFASVVPHTLEEAYEVADAIESGDLEALKGELGDLLFQVVFYAQLGRECQAFEFDDIVAAINDKLIRRHPHVFSDVEIDSAEAQTAAWESYKAQERAEQRASTMGVVGEEPASLLDGVIHALPAQTRAVKLQRRAARVGFDWQSVHQVFDKIYEEIDEVKAELAKSANQARIAEEIGDLIFACTNLARLADVDPETALRGTNSRFESRFKNMEQRLAQRDCDPAKVKLTAEEWEALWQQAKRDEAIDSAGTSAKC
ncbi:MAG: nucleoside triphosphate pyrophosphohydrolase [Gammaproteobacteria bacterium]|nr:nucleoside triphosphate pyrophosphohydrolase [Gammaproteobacteria bacterium]